MKPIAGGKSAFDAMGLGAADASKAPDMWFTVHDEKFGRKVGGEYSTEAQARTAAETLEDEKGGDMPGRFTVTRVVASPSRPIFTKLG
jgi:hypothetical protein